LVKRVYKYAYTLTILNMQKYLYEYVTDLQITAVDQYLIIEPHNINVEIS